VLVCAYSGAKQLLRVLVAHVAVFGVGDILCASIPSLFRSCVSDMCSVLTADEAEANGSGDLEMSYYRDEDNSGQSDRVYGTLDDSTEG
jgi:hypothetical protein